MNTNCLQIVLKQEVDNDNLPILGKLSYIAPNTNGELSYLTNAFGGKGCVISIENGTLYTNGRPIGSSYKATSDDKVLLQYSCTENTKVTVTNKYDLTYVNIKSVTPYNIDEIQYSKKLKEVHGNIVGNIFKLSNMLSLNVLDLNGTSEQKKNLYGDINSVVNCAFDNTNEGISIIYTNMSGEWLDFYRTRHANNMTLNFKVTSYGNNLRFNGNPVGLASSVMTYVNDNKMAFVSDSNNRVYCLGYTDEEIATNTATGGVWDGKSIYKCD